MLGCVIRINKKYYACDDKTTANFFEAKIFSIDEAILWTTKRLNDCQKLFEKGCLRDTDYEIRLLEG